jgi:hypothetical protein
LGSPLTPLHASCNNGRDMRMIVHGKGKIKKVRHKARLYHSMERFFD